MKLIMGLIGVFSVALIVMAAIIKTYKSKLKITESKLEVAEKNNKLLSEQVWNLRKAWEAVDDNAKEAEQKISELHGGDALGNAINGLHDD